MKNMENENKFNAIDDMGGAALESSQAAEFSANGIVKDQMHMPCSGINFFGCGAGGEF
ncbi:hypothetical protein EAL2_c00810 [Peptoclostridium acidaminophilum DSM 3953]|uniref:Uncharacterized protein n=1 Tax=Peptoclostridium acidaminophilum DSM 3953 TaxID=1286171 RepID=W8TC84_PEPAC|nr:hypothetical protein [Peptoclostridium acidaminophilum]AHM55418.1 hypothetical protein EAL2_c00810 [Peptoclostridium acidaminophilum DSM 3953]